LSGAEEDVGLRGSSLIYLLAKEEGRGKEGRCMSALFFILFIFIYFYLFLFIFIYFYLFLFFCSVGWILLAGGLSCTIHCIPLGLVQS
jgi:hypothetical protein